MLSLRALFSFNVNKESIFNYICTHFKMPLHQMHSIDEV